MNSVVYTTSSSEAGGGKGGGGTEWIEEEGAWSKVGCEVLTCDGHVAQHLTAEVLHFAGGEKVRHGPEQLPLTLIIHGVV